MGKRNLTNFHSCTVHLDTTESFIYPTDAHFAQSLWRLATGRNVLGPNTGRDKFFHTGPNHPWGPPTSCTMGTGSLFRGGKAAGAWRRQPIPI